MKFVAAGVLYIVIITFLTNHRGVEINKHERYGITGIRINFYNVDSFFLFFILCIIYSNSKQEEARSTDVAFMLIL